MTPAAPRNRALVLALSANAILMAGILIVLLGRSDASSRFPDILPTAMGQAVPREQPPIAGGAGVFVMPAQFSGNTWGCYLMDIDAQTLVAYQFYPGDRTLRLVSARNFRYDRRLANFNTNPSPLEIKKLTEQEEASNRVTQQNDAPVDPEAPATPDAMPPRE
ncbi:MAG: hypothetical protein ACREIT_06220 [Tepidisphaeraceae bacterium]